MTAASLLKRIPANGLQPVNLARHLAGITDLIELCFATELDAGGRAMLREMRLISHMGPALHLMNALLGQQHPWHLGFVWLEAGRVVGTVSTQRAASRSRTWLVANVAVHPDFRRQGIAYRLMQAALDLAASQGGSEVILQVDDGNQPAVKLYDRMGFEHLTTQTAWSRPSRLAPPGFEPSAYEVRQRGRGDWTAQLALARLVRPHGLAWARPLTAADFRPSLRRTLASFFAGRADEHWVAPDPAGGGLAGSLTMRFNAPEGDQLILLVHPAHRGRLERPLLVRGLRQLGRRPWQVRIEHETHDQAASQALESLGFKPGRVLRWLRRSLEAGQAREPVPPGAPGRP
jgi:ribosomal protein S18 acetylase RimI-like enzyme